MRITHSKVYRQSYAKEKAHRGEKKRKEKKKADLQRKKNRIAMIKFNVKQFS